MRLPMPVALLNRLTVFAAMGRIILTCRFFMSRELRDGGRKEASMYRGFAMKQSASIVVLTLLAVLMSAPKAYPQSSSVWMVKGQKANVYLAGACHVLRASDHPLPSVFEKAYADSGRVFFEAPPGDLESPLYTQKLMTIAVYADGTTLRHHLKPAVYEKARKFCRTRGYPFEQYQLFRPWMLSMMLTMQELARIGVEADFGVDHVFYQRALKDDKPTGGLESAEDQLDFLNMLDQGMANEQVSETVDDLLHLEGKINDILHAWRTGDEEGIEAFTVRELKNYPQLHRVLIVERNKKWAKKIEEMLSGNTNTMVIVGVAHLAGAFSVIDLLRGCGYEVTKVSP